LYADLQSRAVLSRNFFFEEIPRRGNPGPRVGASEESNHPIHHNFFAEYRCGEERVAIFLKSDIKPNWRLHPVP
jgi:hypothetical protein